MPSNQTKPNSFYNQWWFFDTNCLSLLIKACRAGGKDKEAVHRLLDGKYVVIPSTILGEIRKWPELLNDLVSPFLTSSAFVLPDSTKFLYSDIANFLNVEKTEFDALNAYPLTQEYLEIITDDARFNQSFLNSEKQVEQGFFEKVEQDVGANLDERKLLYVIWLRVNELGKQWFNIDIPPADLKSQNFPAWFVYHYAQYYRYVKNGNVTPEANDFNDFIHCSVAPYCERYYCEKTFSNVLNHSVKGHTPSSLESMNKLLLKDGQISKELYERANKAFKILAPHEPLLVNTNVYKYSELKSQLTA